MWSALLKLDSRKNCFLSVPHKWGIDFSKSPVVKIQQTVGSVTSYVYATCIGDNGPLGDDMVVIGAQFARINNLSTEEITMFEICKDVAGSIVSAVAEPNSEGDWEMLELNADQVQMELLSRIRVIWKGALIPIWLSEFVSLTIKIVQMEPECLFGVLQTDTEIHVGPPLKPTGNNILTPEKSSFRSIISNLLDQYVSKSFTESSSHHCLRLRVHPIHESESLKNFMEKNGIICQPYTALIPRENAICYREDEKWIGKISNGDTISYFNVIFVENKEDYFFSPNTVYLTSSLIQQLNLDIKQRVDVDLQTHTNLKQQQCDNIRFYTFCETCDIQNLEKDTKMWLQSVIKDDSKLILNHGQHIDIPCLVQGNTIRLYASISPEMEFCQLSEINLALIEKKIKCIRTNPSDAPKHLRLAVGPSLCLEKSILNLGGIQDLLQQSLDLLKVGLGLSNTTLSSAFSGCHHGNLLLTGPRGSGRTSIAKYLCNELDSYPYYVHSEYIDCSSLKGKKVETLQRDWKLIFQKLIDMEPSILVLDNLDLLASNPKNDQDNLDGEGWYSARIGDLIRELIMETPQLNQLMIIATALSTKSLHPKLNHCQSAHLFTTELSIPVLNQETKLEIMRLLMKISNLNIEEGVDSLRSIIPKMDGYVAADIKNLLEKTSHVAIADCGSTENLLIKKKHFEEVVDSHIPFGLFGIDLKPPESTITLADVGGLSDAKTALSETLKWPTLYPELFLQCPIRMRSAVLLYGAPGTGKTLLACAIAAECSVNFISVKGPELLSKFIGASEESVRATFQRARSAKPCILFFDEFDSLAPRRGHDSTGVTDRVVNQLLTELDGVEGQEVGLWILAATSRPDLIDPALLRPGRFDVAVHCPLPNKDERLEILRALSSRLDLQEDVRLEDIAAEAQNFSGADLQALLYTAQLKAIHEQNYGEKCSQIHITHQLLMSALLETRPSVSASERQRYDRIYSNFSSNPGSDRSTAAEQIGTARVTLA